MTHTVTDTLPDTPRPHREVVPSLSAVQAGEVEGLIGISRAEYEEKLETLRALIAVGAEQADRGEFVNQTIPEMLEEFKAKKRERVQAGAEIDRGHARPIGTPPY